VFALDRPISASLDRKTGVVSVLLVSRITRTTTEHDGGSHGLLGANLSSKGCCVMGWEERAYVDSTHRLKSWYPGSGDANLSLLCPTLRTCSASRGRFITATHR